MSVLADTCVIAGQPSVKTIIFGGELGRRFGRVHRFAADTPAAAIQALCVLIEGLEKFLTESPLKYKIFVDKAPITDAETQLHTCRGAQQYAIMPVLTGSKQAGLAQIIVGVVLIALSFTPASFMTTPMLAGSSMTLGSMMMVMGASMVLGGAITMLMGTRTPTIAEKNSDNNPSYYTNGAVNTTSPGQCVPVGYGEMIVGSAVASVDISTIDIPV